MIMTYNEALEHIRRDLLPSYADEVLTHKPHTPKHTYICPFPNCDSGNGPKGTPAFGLYVGSEGDKKGVWQWKCLSCGRTGDIFDLIGYKNGISDPSDRFKYACEKYGIKIVPDGTTPSSKPSQNHSGSANSAPHQNEPTTQASNKQVEKVVEDYSAYCNEAHRHIGDTQYHRGLQPETLDRFNIGYDPKWVCETSPYPTPRLIIPSTIITDSGEVKTIYTARLAKENQKGNTNRYINQGGTCIFNAEALRTARRRIFVVEGAIDAMSIVDVGGEAIGIGGTSGVNKLRTLLEKQVPVQPLVLALDNDEEVQKGPKANNDLANMLRARNIKFCIFNGYGNYKDANEMLIADRETLKRAVEDAEMLELDKLEVDQKVEGLNTIAQQGSNSDSRLQNSYIGLRQGSVTNDVISRVMDRDLETTYDAKEDKEVSELRTGLCLMYAHPNDDYGIKNIRTSTLQLKTYLETKLTTNLPIVVMPIEEYMQNRGLTNLRKAREQLDRDRQQLQRAILKIDKNRYKGLVSEEFYGKEINVGDESHFTKGGALVFEFGRNYFNLLQSYPKMPVSDLLWQLDIKRNPNSFFMYYKILTHKFMNLGKSNENIMSVRMLLPECPYIPSKEEVMKGNRNIKNRIIDPFIRDLNALDRDLTWDFIENKKPLPKEKREDLNYDQFINLGIVLNWRNYPDMRYIIKARREREARLQEKTQAI